MRSRILATPVQELNTATEQYHTHIGLQRPIPEYSAACINAHANYSEHLETTAEAFLPGYLGLTRLQGESPMRCQTRPGPGPGPEPEG